MQPFFTADMPGEKVCQFRDEVDFCTFFFSYYDHPETGKLMVEVKKTKGQFALYLNKNKISLALQNKCRNLVGYGIYQA